MNTGQANAMDLAELNVDGALKAIIRHRRVFFVTLVIFICAGLLLVYTKSQEYKYTQIIKLGSMYIPLAKSSSLLPENIPLWGNDVMATNQIQQRYIPLAYGIYQKENPDIKLNMPQMTSISPGRSKPNPNDQYLILSVVDHKGRMEDYTGLFNEVVRVIAVKELDRKDEIVRDNLRMLQGALAVVQKENATSPKEYKKVNQIKKQSIPPDSIRRLIRKLAFFEQFTDQIQPTEFDNILSLEPIMTMDYAIKTLCVFTFIGILMGWFVVLLVSSWQEKKLKKII